MGNLGWAEIAVIVVVALVVLGPEKLPGAARQIGNVIRQDTQRSPRGFSKSCKMPSTSPSRS